MSMIRRWFVCGCLALAVTGPLGLPGCGGQPDTGAKQQVTDEEIASRSQGIKNAMKSGGYDIPKQPRSAP